MENEKNVGKMMIMDPLFPRLHINDADKGGQRAPPRNKMALYEHCTATPQSTRFNFDSMTTLSIWQSNGARSFSSSSKACSSPQQKVLPTFCSLPGTSHLVNRYHSYSTGLNLNTSLRDFEPRTSEPTNQQKNRKSVSGNSIPTHQNEHSKESRNEEQQSIKNERITRKRHSSAMDDLVLSSPQLGCNNGTAKIESIKKGSKDEDYGSLQLANADGKEDISDNASVADSVSVLDLTPDDVVGVFGERLFIEARNTILHQQRIFAMQIFELHRLIKVQRLIAGSPEVLHENNVNLTKSYNESRQTNKLLYMAPVDPSPRATKRKFETLNPGKNCGAEAVMDNKLPPPLFSNSPANQWLVPVKSPSEGLMYKPFVVGPVFGNYAASYLQPYTMPLIDPVSVGSDKTSSKIDANLAILGQSLQGDALSPLQAPPSVPVEKEKRNEQRVQVIKVVPHNPKSATESAARIFRSIQEERSKR